MYLNDSVYIYIYIYIYLYIYIYIYIYETCAWTPNNVFLSMIVVESLSSKLECYQYPDHQQS